MGSNVVKSKKLFVPILASIIGLIAIICFILGFNQPYKNEFGNAPIEMISGAKIFALILGLIAILAIIAYFWSKLFIKKEFIRKLVFIAGIAVLGISMFIFFVVLPFKGSLMINNVKNLQKIFAFFMFGVIIAQVALLTIGNFFKPDKSAKFNGIASKLNFIYLAMALILSHNFFAPRFDVSNPEIFVSIKTGALFINFVFVFAFFATTLFLKAEAVPENENRSLINIGALGFLSFILPIYIYATFNYNAAINVQGLITIALQIIPAAIFIVAYYIASVAVANETALDNALITASLILAIAMPIITLILTVYLQHGLRILKNYIPAIIASILTAIAGLVFRYKIVAKANGHSSIAERKLQNAQQKVAYAEYEKNAIYKMKHEGCDDFIKGYSKFDGSFWGMVGTMLWTGFVTIITFGIATPWMICARQRWHSSHTIIDGKRLRFKGKGSWIIGKWICWILLTIITIGIYGLWIPIKLEKWIVKHTIFENSADSVETSVFSGGLLGLIGVNILTALASLLSLGIAFPWMYCFKKRWYAKHTAYEAHPLKFNGKGIGIIGNFMLWILLSFITLGIFALVVPVKLIRWEVKNNEFSDINYVANAVE